MVLQRWDPFSGLRRMEEAMNRLWRGFGRGAGVDSDMAKRLEVKVGKAIEGKKA